MMPATNRKEMAFEGPRPAGLHCWMSGTALKFERDAA
jgi:hypothetical protein